MRATPQEKAAGAIRSRRRPGVPRASLLAILLILMVVTVVAPAAGTARAADRLITSAGGVNDLSCRPTAARPRPVVLLHGLGANRDADLNLLQAWLADRGYCTFARTYGAYPQVPVVGGLRDLSDSAEEIAGYIREVHAATGTKVDLVGHSEGGFQSLFVPKTQDVATLVDHVVAIAPPSHGTTFAGLYRIGQLLGLRPVVDGVLKTFGCVACTQLTTSGSAVAALNDGPITQPDIDYTIITSRFDELVTPPETSFVREAGVTNQYVQDVCPADPVGHIGEAYDTNVWNLVANGIEDTPDRSFPCSVGFPG